MTLLQYMTANGIKPYSRKSFLAELIPLGHQHLGDIALGKRSPSLKLAARIEEVTDGEVTMRELCPDAGPTPPTPTEQHANA